MKFKVLQVIRFQTTKAFVISLDFQISDRGNTDIKRLIYEANPAKYAQYCVKGVVLNAHGIVMSPTSSPAFYGCLVATIRSARAQSQLSTDESQLCSKEARKIVELSP